VAASHRVPLSLVHEQGPHDLRNIARRLLLSEDPVNEPVKVAQAGA
jgi:hypothetical protein